MGRTATAYLSTKNLLHNVSVIKQKAPHSKIIAMVKANAYGHGIRSVSLRLKDSVDLFGVASIDEALILRKVGINTPIILMEGVFEPVELSLAAENDFHVVFHSTHQIEWLKAAPLLKPLNVWIKVNTGLGRLGIPVGEVKDFFAKLNTIEAVLKPIRIMSHFACADVKDHPLNQRQIEQFLKITKTIDTEFSLCNSAGIFTFKDHHYDFIRPGLSLYGVSPFKDVLADALKLKPVMTLKTTLISIQNMKKGDSIGYGSHFVCDEDMPVGVIAFGYGDGYPITAKNGTPVLVNDVRCPLIGRVSMDMMMVDLRPCAHPTINDPVILWGEGLPLEDVVNYTSDITWNMLTSIQHRVKFIWE